MSIETHGVDVEELIEGRLPFAAGTITETSAGLNIPTLERWIKTAAGILNSLLERAGVDPSTLGENERYLVRVGIEAYVEAKAREKREWDGVIEAVEEWQMVRKTIRDRPSELGKSDTQSGTQSNIDTRPAVDRWGKDFSGF